MAYLPSCCKLFFPILWDIEQERFAKLEKDEDKVMATAQKLPKLINGVNVDDLFNTIDAIKATPTIAKFNFRIQNQWEGASQNRSTVNEFYGAGQELSRAQTFRPGCRRTRRPAGQGRGRQSGRASASRAGVMRDDVDGLSRGGARHSDRRRRIFLRRAISTCTDFSISTGTCARGTRASASTSRSRPTCPTRSCRRLWNSGPGTLRCSIP